MSKYNVIRLDCSGGLVDEKIGFRGDFIRLHNAPALANVSIKLGEQSAPAISLTKNMTIKSADINHVFVTCDAIAGGVLEFIQANEDGAFQILDAPEVVDVSEISLISNVSQSVIDRIGKSSYFAPNSDAIQTDILAASSYVLPKGTLSAIRFHSTDEIGVELDSNTIKYPMFEEIINLKNIETDVTFHNDTATTVTLTIWIMP